jgi:hypothetical protein
MTDDVSEAARKVLSAFNEAVARGAKPVDCYLAGVGAWRTAHPDHAAEYAARRAVSVIMAAAGPRLPSRRDPSGALHTLSPSSLSDESLLDQAEQMAKALVNVSFDPKPPPGTREFVLRFYRLVEEIERRDLPLSVPVERCRFMFPPL